jgi:Fe-S cluster biogenesis protein NfuA
MEFDKAVAELEALVETLEREGDERALLLLQLVDAIHRPALERIAAGDTEDPIAQALLQMYDIAPPDDEVLVEEALDEVRPYIDSHGGKVELLGVDDGIVKLRMSGSCAGCAASAMTLKRGIEAALRARYPGFREVIAEESAEQATPELLQIENLRRPVFIDAGEAAKLSPGELRAVELDGIGLLLANYGGEIYALRDGCPVDGNSLGDRLPLAQLRLRRPQRSSRGRRGGR